MTCNYPLYWRGCYDTGSYDLWCPDAYSHPAKMSVKLCYKILDHLKELGWLKDDSVILDPMCGIGTTNLCAGAKGYRSISVELEPKFIELEKQNKEYAERRLYKKLDWQIIQGDSRRLSELLVEKGLVSLTSPPYEDSITGKGSGIDWSKSVDPRSKDIRSVKEAETIATSYGQTEGQIGNLKDTPLKTITSPPYSDGYSIREGGQVNKEYVEKRKQKLIEQGKGDIADSLKVFEYGSRNPSNIGNLRDKPLKTIVSPPHAGGTGHGGQPTELDKKKHIEAWVKEQYGDTGGQIENLPDKPLKTITSPPYEDSEVAYKMPNGANIIERKRRRAEGTWQGYGTTNGQLGKEQGETYLQAMLQVYSEIAKISDVLVVVVKNPTRNGKLRNLVLDTFFALKLCHNLLYCNCETDYIKEGIELDDNEWGIYKKMVKQGESMLYMPITHKQSFKDGKVFQPQPQRDEASTAHRRDKSEDTSKTGIAGLQPRSQTEADRSSTQAQKTEEDMALRDLWDTSELSDKVLPKTLCDRGISSENKQRSQGETKPDKRDKTPREFGEQQPDVARWNERKRSQYFKTQQPQLAESENEMSGERQFHMPDVREGGLYSSPQGEALGRRDAGFQLRGIDNSLPQLSSEERWQTQVCGVCGKAKIELKDRIAGWTIHCQHRALLFEELEQSDLFGETQKKVRGRMSFFKRLAYQKGSPVARWEDVILAVKR